VSTVTTHVLDTSRGRPAAGVGVRLEPVTDGSDDPTGDPGGVSALAVASTDADGRVADLGPDDLPAGRYRLVFATGEYFATSGRETFYPRVTVEFEIGVAGQHYHVPLLVSPYGFTTYRGS
jgi:5-hydroxyisourate hydrolase